MTGTRPRSIHPNNREKIPFYLFDNLEKLLKQLLFNLEKFYISR